MRSLGLFTVFNKDKLTKPWPTVLDLQGRKEIVIIDPTRFLRGIFQGDILFVTLFRLSVNPLSHLFN